jgi:hypothetical protein
VKTYAVVWYLGELEAESPEEAAKLAQDIQRGKHDEGAHDVYIVLDPSIYVTSCLDGLERAGDLVDLDLLGSSMDGGDDGATS